MVLSVGGPHPWHMKKRTSPPRKPIRRKSTRATRPTAPRGQMSQRNSLHEFRTSKAALDRLTDEAKVVLIVGGHIVNEINTLTREFIFNLKFYEGDAIANAYSGIHHFTLMRLLTGKVAEALDFVQQRVFKGKFARDVVPLIEARPRSKKVLFALRKKIGDQTLLKRLRSQHIFHNPADQIILDAYNSLPDDADWTMLAASSRQSVRFPLSHMVTAKALLDATGQTDIVAAIELLRHEVLTTSSQITQFFEHVVITLSEHGKLFSRKHLLDISAMPSINSVVIPPVLSDDA